MKVTYTGNHSIIPPAQCRKLEAKLLKISKMIEKNGERGAHVFLAQERFLHKAEITLNAWGHTLIGDGSDSDAFSAVKIAIDKLEKQVVNLRAKWRATKRHKDAPHRTPEAAIALQESIAKSVESPAPSRKPARMAAASKKVSGNGRVFRVNHHQQRKPMTLDEAMLQLESTANYVVYRDADTDRLSVLLRRTDGHFDLIES